MHIQTVLTFYDEKIKYNAIQAADCQKILSEDEIR